MKQWKASVGRLSVLILAMTLVVAGLFGAQTALAKDSNAPEWTNRTMPGVITFEVEVVYDDGSEERQTTDAAYDVTVIQVRAWELVDNGDQVILRAPGSNTEFSATIWNLGNYEDTFNLSYELEKLEGEDWSEVEEEPDGWTVQILDGDQERSEVTIGAGESLALKIRVTAGSELVDGDGLRVKLVVDTPALTPDIDDLVGLPNLPEKSKVSEPMAVKIVQGLVQFVITMDDQVEPGSDDTKGLERESWEVYPRDTVTFNVSITNPSWAAIKIKDGVSISAEIAIPQGFTLVEDSWDGTISGPEGCEISFDDGTITIECDDEFPADGELTFSFEVTVGDYTKPGNYVIDGQLTYTDQAENTHTVKASDETESGDGPTLKVPELRLVKLYYPHEGGEYPPLDLIKHTITTTPGQNVKVDLAIRNEGNVADTYELNVMNTKDLDWKLGCEAIEPTTGQLEPGQQITCGVIVTVDAGAPDQDEADVGTLKAVSTSATEVESNVLKITIDVTAPNISAHLTVYMDSKHETVAKQVKPGDDLYIEVVITNVGRHVATDLEVTHNVPEELLFHRDSVQAHLNGGTIDSDQIEVTDSMIKIGPVDLAPESDGNPKLIITYSGTLK